MTDQRKRTRLLSVGVQIFLAVFGSAQTVSVPEPPELRAKNHVVSLTLGAVNENGRDFAAKRTAPEFHFLRKTELAPRNRRQKEGSSLS